MSKATEAFEAEVAKHNGSIVQALQAIKDTPLHKALCAEADRQMAAIKRKSAKRKAAEKKSTEKKAA